MDFKECKSIVSRVNDFKVSIKSDNEHLSLNLDFLQPINFNQRKISTAYIIKSNISEVR